MIDTRIVQARKNLKMHIEKRIKTDMTHSINENGKYCFKEKPLQLCTGRFTVSFILDSSSIVHNTQVFSFPIQHRKQMAFTFDFLSGV